MAKYRIGKLELRRNLAGKCDHDDLTTLKKGIENVIGGQWNALASGKGGIEVA